METIDTPAQNTSAIESTATPKTVIKSTEQRKKLSISKKPKGNKTMPAKNAKSTSNTTQKPKSTAKSTKAASASKQKAKANTRAISSQQRQEMIATAAYLLSEKRGFTEGNSADDWFTAEQQIDTYLNTQSQTATAA